MKRVLLLVVFMMGALAIVGGCRAEGEIGDTRTNIGASV